MLNDEAAAKLARLGLAVERVLGSPLDIEWGLRGGEIWLLQARPVTTLPQGRESSFEDRQVWTNANVGEALPDVVTPMTFSVFRPLVHELWRGLLGAGGIQFSEEEWIGLVAGRIYFNYNAVCALRRRAPGLRDRAIEDMFGGRQGTMLALKQIRISESDLPRFKVNPWQMAVGLPMFALGFLLYTARQGETDLASVRRANDELARIVPGSLSDGELLTRIGASSGPEMLSFSKTIKAFIFGFGYSAFLFGLCEQWFGPEGRSTANRLMAGIGDREHAETGYELWLLAEQAARESGLKDVLLSERNFTAFALRLEGCKGGRAFLAQWKVFMHRHGHHARGELELSNPRWSECPDFVLDMVRGYVEAINGGHASPIIRQEALSNQRVALEKKCIGGIGNPLKRAILRLVLYRGRKGSQFRDNFRSELIRQQAGLRQFLLELGRRLVARGRLADENDVFFLEIEEVLNGSLWDPGTDLRALVAGRHAIHEQNLKVTPPPVVVGRFDPRAFVADAVDHGTKVFHGLGVSAGIATGRARVILRADASERVQPGEILVAPFTDPGWTPYFVAAAGIVMDMGGMLSHGSIVAREYGIPAVVNVGPATQIIQTGQWLEVDADRGVVKMLDATPETSAESACGTDSKKQLS